MMRINDVGAFFRAIAPWLAQRNAGRPREFSLGVPDAGTTVSFRFFERGLQLGDTPLPVHIELSRRELTAVVFGCHPDRPATVPEAMSGLFPFYFPIPILDRS